jgi:hypothetical protein
MRSHNIVRLLGLTELIPMILGLGFSSFTYKAGSYKCLRFLEDWTISSSQGDVGR